MIVQRYFNKSISLRMMTLNSKRSVTNTTSRSKTLVEVKMGLDVMALHDSCHPNAFHGSERNVTDESKRATRKHLTKRRSSCTGNSKPPRKHPTKRRASCTGNSKPPRAPVRSISITSDPENVPKKRRRRKKKNQDQESSGNCSKRDSSLKKKRVKKTKKSKKERKNINKDSTSNIENDIPSDGNALDGARTVHSSNTSHTREDMEDDITRNSDNDTTCNSDNDTTYDGDGDDTGSRTEHTCDDRLESRFECILKKWRNRENEDRERRAAEFDDGASITSSVLEGEPKTTFEGALKHWRNFENDIWKQNTSAVESASEASESSLDWNGNESDSRFDIACDGRFDSALTMSPAPNKKELREEKKKHKAEKKKRKEESKARKKEREELRSKKRESKSKKKSKTKTKKKLDTIEVIALDNTGNTFVSLDGPPSSDEEKPEPAYLPNWLSPFESPTKLKVKFPCLSQDMAKLTLKARDIPYLPNLL